MRTRMPTTGGNRQRLTLIGTIAMLTLIAVVLILGQGNHHHRGGYADGTNGPTCRTLSHARLTIAAIQSAPLSEDAVQRDARYGRLVDIKETFDNLAASDDMSEGTRNSLHTASSVLSRAAEAMKRPATEAKATDLLAAMDPVNRNLTWWCDRQAPPV